MVIWLFFHFGHLANTLFDLLEHLGSGSRLASIGCFGHVACLAIWPFDHLVILLFICWSFWALGNFSHYKRLAIWSFRPLAYLAIWKIWPFERLAIGVIWVLAWKSFLFTGLILQFGDVSHSAIEPVYYFNVWVIKVFDLLAILSHLAIFTF